MGTLHSPQWNNAARFTIGRDHHGWWVVNDRLGRTGGLFATEEAAMHFAYGEAGHDTRKICRARADEDVELFDRDGETQMPIGRQVLAHNRRLRRA